ncbi:type IV pilus assembly protein PilB [Butyrivibrio fibrisolvens DSM 3071]|uniref:Type IV pilus assembly protein PilB n=1 Tax=Butyrivibrio fibrisolvens DSM 3071 TaxID=1121131 RepID=A0A1M5X5C9_BUTFI|nr:ATPase, T2SS/T4P/T4SS family [Butyrivibrio fibrisolvens]SHH94728.1 type IV pilus assembly protein PilB [Butyrivibrio fibrisolvens DSM 3071]
MAFTRKRIRIGECLLNENFITQEKLDEALALQKSSGKRLGELLVENGFVTGEQLATALSRQLGLGIVNLQVIEIPDDILNMVPAQILRKHKVLPFEYKPGAPNTLHLAMSDPMDTVAIDDIGIVTNLSIEPVLSTSQSIMLALDKYYGNTDLKDAAEQYARERTHVQEESLQENAEVTNSPIVQLVTTMIESAVRQRASDIHIEPGPRNLRIRFRIDGALYERAVYNNNLLGAIVTRIKIVSGMDISEKRKPLDGRMTQIVDKLEYDIRVSTLPTVYGEKVVMRLASKSALNRSKDQLGLRPDEMAVFDRIISNPNGILLVTGPTGSGKSTTLYTALSELNREDVNIVTVEDPVEANINGINQVQVNPKAELSFASALRSILRQDPDIIMIGEIRDQETASIAVQASITGHLVVSTLHTNSAASTVTRLEDMGLEAYLIADSVIGIIAQRLIRRLCPDCKQAYEASAEEKRLLGVPENEPLTLYKKVGCPKCANTGFAGRTGVYEIMEVTHDLKLIIERKGTADEIKNQALKEGMKTLRMSATKYVLEGISTVDEMKKVSYEE